MKPVDAFDVAKLGNWGGEIGKISAESFSSNEHFASFNFLLTNRWTYPF